eukprot:scaffold40745_cov63-Phaeocystis_antarctica.AAC.2
MAAKASPHLLTCLLALTDVLTILLPQLAGAELDAQRRRRVRGSALPVGGEPARARHLRPHAAALLRPGRLRTPVNA